MANRSDQTRRIGVHEDARGLSMAPTSLARTMHTVPERPRPRAAGAIIVGLVVSAASAATVLGLGHRAPSPYPPVTSSALGASGRYTVSAPHSAPPVTPPVLVAPVGETASAAPVTPVTPAAADAGKLK